MGRGVAQLNKMNNTNIYILCINDALHHIIPTNNRDKEMVGRMKVVGTCVFINKTLSLSAMGSNYKYKIKRK